MPQRHPGLIALSHDHHRGLVLAMRLQKGNKLDPDSSANDIVFKSKYVRRFFREHLKPHFVAEEEILFPLVAQMIYSSKPMIRELLKEHKMLTMLIRSFSGSTSRTIEGNLKTFGSILEEHIRKEERVLFTMIEKEGSPQLLNEIVERMKGYEEPIEP